MTPDEKKDFELYFSEKYGVAGKRWVEAIKNRSLTIKSLEDIQLAMGNPICFDRQDSR